MLLKDLQPVGRNKRQRIAPYVLKYLSAKFSTYGAMRKKHLLRSTFNPLLNL